MITFAFDTQPNSRRKSRVMSRGGRGGRGGFQRSRPGTTKIGGVEISIDDDLGKHLRDRRPQPSELFPVTPPLLPPLSTKPANPLTSGQQQYEVTPAQPLSRDERIQIAKFRALRDRIHAGPLYTVLGDNVRVTKPGTKGGFAAPQFDPFEGMQAYSQKYKRRKRRVPKLDTRPYGKQNPFLPFSSKKLLWNSDI